MSETTDRGPASGPDASGPDATAKVEVHATSRVLNADAFAPCRDCGGLFFLGNSSVTKLAGLDADGASHDLGILCRLCLERHPEIKRMATSRIQPARFIPSIVPGGRLQ